jgi:hypothetical protein
MPMQDLRTGDSQHLGESPMNRITIYSFSALAWIAVSFGLIAAADARPFDPMMGCWSGQAQLYDQTGVSQGTANSTGSVSWKTPYTKMHFKQVTQTPSGDQTLEYDFDVVDKVAKFRSADIDVTGTEMDSRTYEFVLHFKNQTDQRYGIWYNVHYFTAKNRRLVMGGFQAGTSTDDSEVERLATQRLKRVACPATP